MGMCTSRQEPVTKEDLAKQRAIEKQLRKDRKKLEHEVKLLLLGAGESGKSTFAKQMKIIYLTGFDSEEKKEFVDVVHSNVLMNMRALLLAAKRLEIPLEEKNQKLAEEFGPLHNPISTQVVDAKMAAEVKQLWSDKGIQKVYRRANEFQLSDSAKYFIEKVDKYADPNFVPTEEDVLRSRAKTTGISETDFSIDSTHFKMVDVGGQRSERKKWIHCFQDVTAVIFFVALSEYNQTLYEDQTVNRMHESLKLFDEICNSRWFARTSIILFLNKRDLFEQKIKKHDLKIAFPNYDGGCNYEPATEYIKTQFENLNRTDEKHVYPHITCATDTDDIRFVFSAVKDIILHRTLLASGF